MPADYPLIGIPCRADTSGLYPGHPINTQTNAYIEAVVQAGGIPLLIPLEVNGARLESLFERLDGLVLAGGGDVDPACYRQTPQVDNLTELQPARDALEIRLANLAVAGSTPFLAICRGFQVLNVALGGSLWQDLTRQRPDLARHDYYLSGQAPHAYDYLAHPVNLEPDSRLRQIIGLAQLPVNSLHHQGIREVAPGLRPAGRADDGLVEVLEAPDHPFGLGVQWHPEELLASRPEARQLFAAFIEAARRRKRPG